MIWRSAMSESSIKSYVFDVSARNMIGNANFCKAALPLLRKDFISTNGKFSKRSSGARTPFC